jgi:hypothetical protein
MLIPRSVISLVNRVVNLLPKRTKWWLEQSDPSKRFQLKCWVWMTVGETVELAVGWLVRQTTGSFHPQTAKE